MFDRLWLKIIRRYNKWRFAGHRYTEAQKAAIRLRAKGRI